MKFYLITILLLLTMVSFSLAIDTTGLIAYYTMNDAANSTIEDIYGSYDLQIGILGNGTIPVQGLFAMDQALRFPAWNSQTRFYTPLGFNLTKQNFCVNIWTKNITTSSNLFSLSNNASLKNSVYIAQNSIRLYNNSQYVAGNTTPLNLSNWNMITYCNDQTDFYLYVNGQLIRQSSINFLPNAGGYLSLGYAYSVSQTNYSTNGIVDELSVWNVKLTDVSILQLYNTGIGLSYSDLSSGSSVTNLQYWYNVCMENKLCKILEVNGTSASCAGNNTVFCFSPCFDQQNIYESYGYTPANHSYDGDCGYCTNECPGMENATQCLDSLNLQTCHLNSAGCYVWYTSYCGNNHFCDMDRAICQEYTTPITNGSNVPIGSTSQSDQDLWENFFNLNASKASNKLLIAILAIIICGAFAAGLLFALGNATGQSMPTFVSIPLLALFILIPTIYFISIGFIPLWILILLIIICASIFAVYVRNEMIGAGGS